MKNGDIIGQVSGEYSEALKKLNLKPKRNEILDTVGKDLIIRLNSEVVESKKKIQALKRPQPTIDDIPAAVRKKYEDAKASLIEAVESLKLEGVEVKLKIDKASHYHVSVKEDVQDEIPLEVSLNVDFDIAERTRAKRGFVAKYNNYVKEKSKLIADSTTINVLYTRIVNCNLTERRAFVADLLYKSDPEYQKQFDIMALQVSETLKDELGIDKTVRLEDAGTPKAIEGKVKK
jgi:hypothetical protein